MLVPILPMNQPNSAYPRLNSGCQRVVLWMIMLPLRKGWMFSAPKDTVLGTVEGLQWQCKRIE